MAIRPLVPPTPEHESEDTAGDATTIVSAQCTNAKDQGIIIYTVAFGASEVGEAMLRDCASSTGHAYVADGAGDLVTAFAAIATKLSTVYLSQ